MFVEHHGPNATSDRCLDHELRIDGLTISTIASTSTNIERIGGGVVAARSELCELDEGAHIAGEVDDGFDGVGVSRCGVAERFDKCIEGSLTRGASHGAGIGVAVLSDCCFGVGLVFTLDELIQQLLDERALRRAAFGFEDETSADHRCGEPSVGVFRLVITVGAISVGQTDPTFEHPHEGLVGK